MKSCRIHIMGASGSGVTSLGRALAEALAVPHPATDDYFWQPTVPPYQKKRERAERLRLMQEVFLPRADWILSGSLEGWGDDIIPRFDLVIFLSTPREIRLQRLRARDAAHFGSDAVAPGGWRHQETEDFVAWGVALRGRRSGGPEFGETHGLARAATLPRPAPRRIAAVAGAGRRLPCRARPCYTLAISDTKTKK
jgi:adenylate kinase family enzyme